MTELHGRTAAAVEVLRGGVEIVERIADEWRELCDNGPCDQPFYRPEWVGAYARAFAPTKNLCLFTVRIEGSLKAILPLEQERTFFSGLPVTKLRGATGLHSFRYDLVRTGGEEGDAAVQALWNFLKSYPPWDLLELPYVPEDGVLPQLLTLARADGFLVGQKESFRSPYIALADWSGERDKWPEYISGRFRKDLRRVARQLAAQGDLQLRRIERADIHLVQCFYELERSGWKGREESAIACAPRIRQFYDELARAADRFGYLSLYLLELNGQMVAGHFGLTYRGRYFSPKVAYDERYKQYSPGQVLMHLILRDCAARGIREFDILGPWAEWKGRWTPLVRTHFRYYIFRKTWYGHLLFAASFRMRARAKRILRWMQSAKNAPAEA